MTSCRCRSGSEFPWWCRSGSGLSLKRWRSTCGSDPKYYTSGKIRGKKCSFIHNNARIQCFSCIISGKGPILYWIAYWNFLGKSKKKYMCLELKTDPDRDALYANPNPDPAKWCGSDPTRSTSQCINAQKVWTSLCVWIWGLPAWEWSVALDGCRPRRDARWNWRAFLPPRGSAPGSQLRSPLPHLQNHKSYNMEEMLFHNIVKT